jgi:hypothetical protein
MSEFVALTISYTGWTLSEIKDLTHKERHNWIEISKQYGMTARK